MLVRSFRFRNKMLRRTALGHVSCDRFAREAFPRTIRSRKPQIPFRRRRVLEQAQFAGQPLQFGAGGSRGRDQRKPDMVCAPAHQLLSAARIMRPISAGISLAATLISPCAPTPIDPRAMLSSPEKILKPRGRV